MSAVIDMPKEVKKPSFLWFSTEIWRAALEYGLMVPYRYFHSQEVAGDGHPVLVIPGFMATDKSTQPLRDFMDELGYSSYGWGLGRNYGDEEHLDLLLHQVDELYQKHKQKVTLIGWSLGGIFVRQTAKTNPHLIRQVITLGSPFGSITDSNRASWLHKLITGGKGDDIIDPELLLDIPKPAPVPTTAIYSKQDGIVPWEYCMEEESDIHQNIQVIGSHLGFGVNPIVLNIIEDRLRYNVSDWVKYQAKSKFEERLIIEQD